MPQIQCPSGFTFEARKIKGREIIAIAEQAEEGTVQSAFVTLVGGCWLSTVWPMPYPFVQEGAEESPMWMRLLKGDVLFALIELRRISMPDGNEYDFDVRCEACGKKYGWTVLLNQLPKIALPVESVTKLSKGLPFVVQFDPLGPQPITFELQTMDQEQDIAKLLQSTDRVRATLIDTLASQIKKIGERTPTMRQKFELLSDLDYDALMNLRAQFEAADCGIDTEFKTRCKHCRNEQEVALPLGKSFFGPRRAKPAAPADQEEALPALSAAPGAGTSSSPGA